MHVHVHAPHVKAKASDNCPVTLTNFYIRTMNEFFEQCSKVFSFQWLIKWLGMVVLLLVSTPAYCKQGGVLCWLPGHHSTIEISFSEGQDIQGLLVILAALYYCLTFRLTLP